MGNRGREMQMRATIISCLVLLAGCSQKQPPRPTFIITDDKTPDQALAVYVPQQVLRKHGVTAAQYEAAFRELLDAVAEGVASIVADMVAGDTADTPAEPDKEAPVWLDALLKQTRAEIWRLDADGTHEVVKVFPSMQRGK